MDTPGTILKAERVRQGKSLKSISVSLKLSNEYLTAIEEDNYSELPAEVFIKAYLRLYADEIGLDGDYILDLYHDYCKDDVSEKAVLPEIKSDHSLWKSIKNVLGAVNAPVMSIKSFIKIDPGFLHKLTSSLKNDFELLKKLKPSVKIDFTFIKRAAPFLPRQRSLLIVAAAVVVAVMLGVILIRYEEKPVTINPLNADKQFSPAKTSIADTKEITADKQMKTPVRKKKKQVMEKISGKLVLQIIAEELTWASVSIDGGAYKESLLHAGDAVTVKADGKMDIKIGNAGGTRLVLNGRELGKLGPHGKVASITLP